MSIISMMMSIKSNIFVLLFLFPMKVNIDDHVSLLIFNGLPLRPICKAEINGCEFSMKYAYFFTFLFLIPMTRILLPMNSHFYFNVPINL